MSKSTFGKYVAAPLLFLNFLMYICKVGFASWCLNRYINGQNYDHAFGGNGATVFFLIFSLLAGVIGVASKPSGSNHIKAWRNESLASATATALIAWSITALSFGLACKEIHIGGQRGWRLKVLEALSIILTFTQLLYLLSLHTSVLGNNNLHTPGYRDGVPPVDPMHAGGPAGQTPRV